MKIIKTEWYPATIKPVRDGWYEVKGRFAEKPNGGIVMRKWTEGCWRWRDFAMELTLAGVSQKHDKWRGIARPAKARKEPT